MYDWMPDPPRAWRSAEKDEAEEGSRTWWNHKWNVETPRPWGKAYPTAHLQPKLVDRYCTNNLEGSCHKTHSKKGKRQAGSFKLLPNQSAQLCWKAPGEDHQQKAHMASWVKLSSGFTHTGYRQFRSTEDQLALLTQDVEDAFQEKKKVLAVFFDLSKAFDKVWKEGLLLKLLRAGVHGKMYKWLSDFLFNRTARVKLDGTISRQVKLREGVPQGGVVSPTLFLVYINDITTTVPRYASNTLHADDFAVRCAEEHTTTAVHRIQITINEVCSWTESWALQLNTTKTVSTLFTLSTAKEKVSLRLNNQPVPQVETPTFLGVTLNTRLTWKPHLEAVEAKATRKLAIMKKLAGTTWGANSNILKQVYTGAVRPVVEYASTIWDTVSKTNKSKLDRVQNMGLRIILGAMRSTPIQQMEKTTDLQALECRHEYKAAIQGEKLKRLTSHPLHQKLQHGTKNRLKRKSFKHKLKDLQKENADLLEADPGKFEELTMSLPEVRTEIPGLAAKGTQTPELQKALTLEMIQSRYPKSTWTHVFTDGSAENAVRNGGSGAYIRRPDGTTFSLSIPAGDLSSNYRAEVHALKAATELLTEGDCNQQNTVLLSDSLSALQSLTSSSSSTFDMMVALTRFFLPWVPHIWMSGTNPLQTPRAWFWGTHKWAISAALLADGVSSLWQVAPPTFTPSSYTTACILYQTTTE